METQPLNISSSAIALRAIILALLALDTLLYLRAEAKSKALEQRTADISELILLDKDPPYSQEELNTESAISS